MPVTFRDAVGYVREWCKFCQGVADEDGVLHGVAITGRPVARWLDDGTTLEVTRSCTDGTPNANSMLYAAAWRAARALGYGRLITYTRPGETGASLRGAGWRIVGRTRAQTWDRPSRPRGDRAYTGIPKTLWEAL